MIGSSRTRLGAVVALCLALTALPGSVVAQRVGGRSEVFAGGELENYLRALQATGRVPLYPWSLRAFSPREVDSLVPRDSTHPWAHRYDLAPKPATRGLWVDLVRPRVTLIENSGFPFGQNDGPVWAGRGLTTVVQGGVALRYGRFSATIAPLVFRAENAAFDLMPNGETGKLVYADGYAEVIDRPQRFGSGPYTVLDPGQSTLRVDLGKLTAGISTANQTWGPADQSPLILSNNAAGFPNLFFGTTRPVDLWVARVHARLVYADLRQSGYSTVTGSASRRFGSGYVIVAQPRQTRGLELGVARFFHRGWPPGGPGLRDFTWLFQAILKGEPAGVPESLSVYYNPDNQLISAFARYLLPASGLELYGEFAREDNARGLRDLVAEPDHISAYTLGMRKVVGRSVSRFVVIRGEVMNARVTNILSGGRGEGTFYYHTMTRQGHTYRGQILAAADGLGGGAAMAAVDAYSPGGRWSFEWSRGLRGIRGGLYPASGAVDARGIDAVHTIGVSVLLFRGAYDVSGGLAASLNLNRDFGRDAANVSAYVGVRAELGVAPR